MSSLPSHIADTIAILSRGSEGIDAVMGTTHGENRFSNALTALRTLAESEGIPIAIVGGLGAIRYGYPAATQDIDIAVSRDDLDKLVRRAKEYGFRIAWESKSGWHTLTHGDVEINVVPEGGKSRDDSPTTIPGPRQMGVAIGLDYATLERWMELKISSGRQKDRAHVVEVLKKSSQATVEMIERHLHRVHTSYVSQFLELRQQAIVELEQEQSHRRD
jgi:hypothetical protein